MPTDMEMLMLHNLISKGSIFLCEIHPTCAAHRALWKLDWKGALEDKIVP